MFMDDILQLGSVGDEVKILQEKLKILGFYNAVITGSFGLSTEVGVRAFQEAYELEVTGMVDDNTWNLLYELTSPTIATISVYPTISYGDSGTSVRDLQTKLKTLLYYTGDINANFDLETENAVKRLQMNNDITANGIVNSATWNLINSLYGNLAPCVVDNEDQDNDGDNYITYTVESGDTLYAIARKYDTTVDAIKKLNNLTSNTLNIGQTLKIPLNTDESTNYITYTVVSGDTLYAIARRYDTTVDAIKRLNNLTSNTLNIGQTLKIPVNNNDEEGYITYTVVSGDTLYAIARRYDTTVDAIKKLNNLTSNTLSIGQILKIPVSNNINYFNYVVQSGDTLYSIARRYNTTVDTIKSINNLTSNTLNIGEVLLLPL